MVVAHEIASCLAVHPGSCPPPLSLTACPFPLRHPPPRRLDRFRFNHLVRTTAKLNIEIVDRIESTCHPPNAQQSCRPVDSPVSAKNIQETLRKSAEYQAAHPTNGGGGDGTAAGATQ